MTNTPFPIVTINDVPPAGKPSECFWCNRKIGQEHAYDCSTVVKKVRLKAIITYETTVPHSYSKEDIEFKFNEGAWCADNLTDEIFVEGECLCNRTHIEYIKTIDNMPKSSISYERVFKLC